MRGSWFVLCALAWVLASPGALGAAGAAAGPGPQLFTGSDRCMACHNGLSDDEGNDVSFGFDWRATMMANAARDPYWHAAIRRETLDHPAAAAAIEDECSKCHLPMDRYQAHAGGGEGEVFRHTEALPAPPGASHLGLDGVSCTTCHQILPEGLGERDSFVGGFRVDADRPAGERIVHGPFDVDAGRAMAMQSASGFRPTPAEHVASSELCASCHTLYTHTLGPDGQVLGELPEQVPYLEWLHSSYADRQGCVSCHMRAVESATAISSVLPQPREGVVRHVFQGGNFVVPRMLAAHRDELGPIASGPEFERTVMGTEHHLREAAARLTVVEATVAEGQLSAEIRVANLAGHKLPTAYPSRRVWLHVTVEDVMGRTVFESGALTADGAIVGNDNDEDGARYEPHHEVLSSPDQVQIFEAILAGPDDAITTGLLTATHYAKDNRIPPTGFDEATAHEDIAVKGAALDDDDHGNGGDHVRYEVDISAATGPFTLIAELWYQPIGFRWAHSLGDHDADENRRFVGYYEQAASASALLLTRASAPMLSPPPPAAPPTAD